MARRTNYLVSFAYICDNGETQAASHPRLMKDDDVKFALAMVDPFKYEEWIEQMGVIRRHGDRIVLKIMSDSPDRGVVGRIVEIMKP